MTVGDNLYPQIDTEPTPEEFEQMLDIFQRPHLKDLKVHAVRGNHDAYFDWDAEVKLTGRNDQWYMPSLFYEKQVEVGAGGEKMGLLFVDSSLMLCASYSYAGDSGGHMLLMHEEHIRLRDVQCTHDSQQTWGDRQYRWINETLNRWDDQPELIWRAVVLHHPLWGKWYPDFAPLVLNFLPILLDHKFDLYLCGHEHVVSYASYPYSQVPTPTLAAL